MKIHTRFLGLTDYVTTYEAMREFTATRDENSPDELWLTQHHPVFTQGQAGKSEHLLVPNHIPVVQSDRGGQITYHGPGQVVLYFLIDIKRAKIGVREMVTLMEETLINLLAECGVTAFAKAEAPGVYVDDKGVVKKIASLGLRIRNGRTYHGLALNVDMDLSPFSQINPCGYRGLSMTQLSDCVPLSLSEAENKLVHHAKVLLEQKMALNPQTDKR